MATKPSYFQVSEQNKLLLLKLKTALAMAIIRSKPEGTSAKEFSQKLASGLRNRNEDWRRRAEDLQQEVLELRQELLLRRVSEEATESEVQEVFSEDLFGPSKDTDGPMDSDSETPDLLLDVSTNTYVLPPACAAGTAATTAGTTATSVRNTASAAIVFRETTVQEPLPHVQFLQALCALQPFSCPRSDPLVRGGAPEAGSVLEESVVQLLRSVWAHTAPGRAPAGVRPSPEALLWACEVCSSALEVYCSNHSPSSSFSPALEELTSGLVHSLLHQVCDSAVECVLTLARSRLLRSFLIRQILSQLSAVTDQLWTLLQASDPELNTFPLVPFENSCSLMWILEQLLPIREDHTPNRPIRGEKHVDVSLTRPITDSQLSEWGISLEPCLNEPMRAGQCSNEPIRRGLSWKEPFPLDLSSVQTTLERLQTRVFPLSQEFPLFSVCLWRVLGLISNSNKTMGHRE